MTFQVGMPFTEGVVLASDRKLTNIVGYRHGRLTPKIEVHEDCGLAHCSSGDGFCETFTQIVRDEMLAGKDPTTNTFLEIRDWLESLVLKARAKEKQYREALQGERVARPLLPIPVGGSTLLVFRGSKGIILWIVNTLAATPTASPVEPGDRAVAGDSNTPAVFFLEHYYSHARGVNEAIPLAVHAVLMAKGDFVEGITVGVFTGQTFRVLTEAELKPFLTNSGQLDGSIGVKLTTPLSQFP